MFRATVSSRVTTADSATGRYPLRAVSACRKGSRSPVVTRCMVPIAVAHATTAALARTGSSPSRASATLPPGPASDIATAGGVARSATRRGAGAPRGMTDSAALSRTHPSPGCRYSLRMRVPEPTRTRRTTDRWLPPRTSRTSSSVPGSIASCITAL